MEKVEYENRKQSLRSMLITPAFGEKLTPEQSESNKAINSQLKDLNSEYLNVNKPCDIGDIVNMVLNSGRKVRNAEIVELGILHDGMIHPTAYKIGSKTMFITVPIQSIEVVLKSNTVANV